jgi:MauM/NapG family ferredoxin protein
MKRPRWSAGTLRRVVQICSLVLFVALFLAARPIPAQDPPGWLKVYFWLDPLLLVVTFLAAHAVAVMALLAVVTIVVTIVLGRIFCGWVCPLGVVHDIAGRLIHGRRTPPATNRYSPWQKGKYYLLVAMLVAAIFGAHWISIFDPLVLFYRTLTAGLFPTVQWAIEEGSTAVYQKDPGLGPFRLVRVTEPLYLAFRDRVRAVEKQAFLASGGILAFFVVIVALNAYRRRWWCRFVCPLGALLGVFAWRPLLRRTVSPESCNQCELCGMNCHGAAAGAGDQKWRPSECFGCLNCTEACRRGALHFRWVWPWRSDPTMASVDLSRRGLLASAVGGITVFGFFRATPLGRAKVFNPQLIRPPGARPEPEFLARCTGCSLCMKICPTGALHPCFLEAGLEGIWTPRLVPKLGYCSYDCNRCGLVCPTEAIRPLSLAEKRQVKMGLATFDTSRCIPYAYGRDCMVCEEHCPIPEKAIYFREVEVLTRDGEIRRIKQPRVDPAKCIGCGVCEHVCVYRDLPAIRVTSANESRHLSNQPLPAWEESYY